MKLLLPNGRGGRFHQVLRWIDAHGLMIWASFLLAFIPLWPKIPLWSPIEQYIARGSFGAVLGGLYGLNGVFPACNGRRQLLKMMAF
jgi:hypothetical protein